jgi:hypothetical protein
MRSSAQFTLVVLAGLITVADTGSGTISAGLKYTNFTHTDKPQKPTLNGLNHLYIGGEFKATELFSVFAHLNHSLKEELITIDDEGDPGEVSLKQSKRFGADIGISYHLLPNVDIFVAGAVYQADIVVSPPITVTADEKYLTLGVTTSIYQSGAFLIKARSSIGIGNASIEEVKTNVASTSFAFELAYDL